LLNKFCKKNQTIMVDNHIRQNSDSNLKAAELLFENFQYAPSVHCAYYSVFQLIKCVINDFFGCNFEDQEKELIQAKLQKATKNIGVHSYTISKFCNETKKYSTTEYLFFNRNIKDLQNFRLNSDYKNIAINLKDSETALKIAKEINEKIIDKFHV